jgi:capsular exopolysaccharide synthesis family protein
MNQDDIRVPIVLGNGSPGKLVAAGGIGLSNPSPELQPSELLQFARIIGTNKLLLVMAALLGLGVALLVARLRTPTYQTHALIELQGINEHYLNMQSLDPLASDEQLAPSYLQTQLKILQSKRLLRDVVNRLSLGSRPEFDEKDPPWKRWLGPLGSLLPQPEQIARNKWTEEERRKKAALEWLRDAVTGRVVPETRLIEITTVSADPALASLVANTVADQYIKHSLDSRWESIKQTSDWISPKLDELQSKLEASERALQAYAESSGVMFMSEGENSVAETKLLQLEAELSKAEAERVSKQTEYELASSTQPEFFPKAAEDAASKEFQIKLTDLRRQLAEFRENYTPSHYKVLQTQAQIKELEAALAAQHVTLAKRIGNAFTTAQRREELLKQQYQAQAKLVSDQAAKIVRYNVLKHEVKSNQDIYDQLLRQLKAAGVASAMHANNIRVLDAAEPQLHPDSPDLKWHSIIGLVGGLFSGVLFIFGRQHADRTMHGPGQTARYLSVSELGCIPKIPAKRSIHLTRNPESTGEPGVRSAASVRETLGINAPVANVRHGTHAALVSWYEKSSLPAECFRAAVASLRLSSDSGAHPRIIVVTSAGPSEGKTTMVANLGIALAEIEKSVLLVDADVHRPRLHNVFGLSNQTGLISLLKDTKPTGEYSADELGKKTGVPGLSLLPTGPVLPLGEVNGLLNSDRVPALLAALKREYGTVLIDTPPALGVSYARVLARLADATILVIRAEHTTIEVARAAYQRLVEDRIHVDGTILNGVSLHANQAYYRQHAVRQ